MVSAHKVWLYLTSPSYDTTYQDVPMTTTLPVTEDPDHKDDPEMGQVEGTGIHHSVETGARTFKGGVTEVGQAVIEQDNEYWAYIFFYFHIDNIALRAYGAAAQQALLNESFPSGFINWGGSRKPLDSMLLDLNGILFAVQLGVLVFLGPYADYGNWRNLVLRGQEIVVWVIIFTYAGLTRPSQWQAANAFYILGNLMVNIGTTFYQAAFLSLVRDLPHLRASEEAVINGSKSPAGHAMLDTLERSKLFNVCNIISSALNIVLLSVATGISAGIGNANQHQVNKGYQVLLIFFGLLQIVFCLPYLILMKKRPGQALPDGAKWYTAGIKQCWQAAKHAKDLKQILLFLLATFILLESESTCNNVIGLQQNKIINYNTVQFSGFNLLGYVTGGTGTLFFNFIQQRYKISPRVLLRYGGFHVILISLWGVIGIYTRAIGYHHLWEFWFSMVWNFNFAAWASYQVIVFSEVCPAPKAYLFFTLFNFTGKTSAFIGPFVASGIIDAADGNQNYALWFSFGLSLLGYAILWCVNPDKAKMDNARFLEREAEELYAQAREANAAQEAVLTAQSERVDVNSDQKALVQDLSAK